MINNGDDIMDKTYTFKHVIFGLREEYLKIEKELRELEKYVDVNKNIIDYYFGIFGNPCELSLNLSKKLNWFERILGLERIRIGNGLSYNVTEKVKYVYCRKNKPICLINNPDELSIRIKQIVGTDFFKKIIANNHGSIPCLENDHNSLLISSGGMWIFRGQNTTDPYFNYWPRKDEFDALNLEKAITPDDIYRLLNLRLDGSYLNDYHRNILDNFEEKELDIYDFALKGCFKLDIIEEPKKLILKPKNIKH